MICTLISSSSLDGADKALPSDIDSFELIWSTLRDRYWDPTMAGKDWEAVHSQYRARMERAKTHDEAEALLNHLTHELPSSHLALIPERLYRQPSPPAHAQFPGTKAANEDDNESGEAGLDVVVIGSAFAVERITPGGAASKAGVQLGWTIDSVEDVSTADLLTASITGSPEDKQFLAEQLLAESLRGPVESTVHITFRDSYGHSVTRNLVLEAPPGTSVQFGNLPPEHVVIEHHLLPSGAGYIRLNVFLDPVLVMPEFQRAIKDFQNAPGIVLDLRGNPGGIWLMASGLAGWFVSKGGQQLGVMTSRDGAEPFRINPRLHGFSGRVAILVDHGSASTSEIFAQGLKDLGRARIFGTRTAGAALPSEILQLPNGDRFQYPEASYTSANGLVLEGNGVEPDERVAPTLAALAQGIDLPLEAAAHWASSEHRSATLENKPQHE